MKYSDLAKKYNVEIRDIKRAEYDFVQSEGYLPNGTECETLMDWLDKVFEKRMDSSVTEPWQKSDLNYGL